VNTFHLDDADDLHHTNGNDNGDEQGQMDDSTLPQKVSNKSRRPLTRNLPPPAPRFVGFPDGSPTDYGKTGHVEHEYVNVLRTSANVDNYIGPPPEPEPDY
jgi:hypothetical protein